MLDVVHLPSLLSLLLRFVSVVLRSDWGNHNETWVGCIVSRTTATNCLFKSSRSTSLRITAPNVVSVRGTERSNSLLAHDSILVPLTATSTSPGRSPLACVRSGVRMTPSGLQTASPGSRRAPSAGLARCSQRMATAGKTTPTAMSTTRKLAAFSCFTHTSPTEAPDQATFLYKDMTYL